MSQEVTETAKRPPKLGYSASAKEIRAQVNLIQEVLREVMIKGTHYDTIPGTQAPTLLKPGAEKILATFRIACMPEVEDLSSDGEFRYRVIAKGVHQPSGTVVGAGVGECSTAEEKYAWRGVICEEEWDATPEDRRRTKFYKGYGNNAPTSAKQVRTNPADASNTCLKMSKKRAMVDLALTATAASDVFVQDVEDMPAELREQHDQKTKAARAQPRVASGNSSKQATEGQCRLLRAKLNANGKTEEDLCQHMKVDALESLTMGSVNDCIAWVEA